MLSRSDPEALAKQREDQATLREECKEAPGLERSWGWGRSRSWSSLLNNGRPLFAHPAAGPPSKLWPKCVALASAATHFDHSFYF